MVCDRRIFLPITIATAHIVNFENFNSPVHLFPYLNRHIGWHELSINSYPVMLLLYQVLLYLFNQQSRKRKRETQKFSYRKKRKPEKVIIFMAIGQVISLTSSICTSKTLPFIFRRILLIFLQQALQSTLTLITMQYTCHFR